MTNDYSYGVEQNRGYLKALHANGGVFDSLASLKNYAAVYPNHLVCIRFGCSPRILTVASMAVILSQVDYGQQDYIRDIFLPCEHYDALEQALGIVKV